MADTAPVSACMMCGRPLVTEAARRTGECADCTLDGDDSEWVVCWDCDGEGGWHNCGEDVCPCADPEDATSDDWLWCETCDGDGGWNHA